MKPTMRTEREIETAARHWEAALSGSEPPSHPGDELPDYLAETLSPQRRAAVEMHLHECEICSVEVNDLRRWAETYGAPADGAPANGAPASSRPVRRLPAGPLWSAALAAAALLPLVLLGTWRPEAPTPDRPIVAVPQPVPVPPASPPQPPPYARPAWATLVSAALRTGHVEIPKDIAEFRAEDIYRGPKGRPSVQRLTPTATAVEQPRPTFTWPASFAGPYEVLIYADDGEALLSPRVTEARWRPQRPLVRGRLYRWQVRTADGTILPERPLPPAAFRILSAREQAELAAARRAHPADDLLLGLLSARAGLLDDARDHLQRHARMHPSPEAQRLASAIASR